MSAQGRGNNNQQQQTGMDFRKHDNLTPISKGVFFAIVFMQYIGLLFLGWQAYAATEGKDPWLPMPGVDTFLVAATMLFIFGILWVKRASYNGE